MFYFNMYAHNFISGYVIVQHHPNFTYTYTHTHIYQNHKQISKMKKKQQNNPTHNCQSDTGMKLK